MILVGVKYEVAYPEYSMNPLGPYSSFVWLLPAML